MSPDERTPRLYHFTATDAALGFCLALATFILVPVFAGAELAGLVLAEAIGLALVPIALVRARGLPLATLGLAWPDRRAVVGAIAIGAGVWYVAAYATEPWARLLRDDGEATRPLEALVAATPLAALVALSLVPAVCEEIANRGLLALGLRRGLGPTAAVLISAAAFAAMHLSLVRALPTGMLGVILAVVTLRSGSVVPAMIAHALNNAFALAVATDRAPPVARAVEAHPHLCAVGAAALVAGGLGIALSKRN